MQKEIRTLPPLEVLTPATPVSPRTGEPPRPAALWASSVALHLASAALAGAYARHWWLAAHPETYAASARLIEWLEPEPGKWLSLLIEGVLALVLVLAAGACSVAAYQTYQGWRRARTASPAAVAVAGGFAAILNDWAFVGLGLAIVGAALLWLPGVTAYFARWEQLRSREATAYRSPDAIHYGPLHRYSQENQ